MESYKPQASLFEVQPGMNTPWGFQNHLNNLATLPMMRVPAFNAASCFCPSMNTPQLPSRSPANVYKSNLKVQAQIQTQQIDSAIQLLKMQYDAIMASVQKSNLPLEGPNQQPSTSATSSQVVDQKSFVMQFELPRPESDEQSTATRVMDTATACKRKTDRQSDGISIASVDSESCSLSKTPASSLQSNKRLRRQ
uniref:Uncharacterized protein n=1 Tax=Cryptomonas curvata TaxID=233186 RepID=A0A7S0QNC8_9CRYP|mmetsp:Transcript_44538/g.93180  ORF Transcript_44538/g.93180 Transcript_44538/m.93180 type:complete len:195 (+) Transcript_44538:40-624(+)